MFLEWLTDPRRRIKTLFYVGGLVTLLLGAPFLAVVVGVVAGSSIGQKLYDRRLADLASRNDNSQSPSQERNTRSVSVSKKSELKRNGWGLRSIPIDMRIDSVKGRDAVFTAAGIEGLVHGRRSRSLRTTDKAEYTFKVTSDASSERVAAYISSNGSSAVLELNPDGKSFTVRCHDLDTVNALAKEAYPRQKKEVERQVTHVKQFAVKGVSSYEEAVQLLKDDISKGTCLNSYVSVEDKVGGVSVRKDVQGSPVDSSFFDGTLNAGVFIVNQEEVLTSKGELLVPSGLKKQEELASYVSSNFNSVHDEHSDSRNERFSDGLPEGIERHLVIDASGHRMPLRDPDDVSVLAEDHLKAYAVLPSLDAVKDIINDGSLREGTFLSIGTKAPEVGAGRYVLELELGDTRVRDAVSMQEMIPAYLQARADELGISYSTLEYSMIADGVKNNGGVSAMLDKALDYDTLAVAKINGLWLDDLRERITGNNMPELSEKQLMQWAKDAAEIKSVSFEVDIVAKEMRIRSVVGDDNIQKTEVKKLSDKEIDSLSNRGSISKTELKDLLMQMHPDYFRTYSTAGGKSVFEDPLKSFIEGTVPSVRSTAKKTVLKKPVESVKTAPVRKPKGVKV